MNQNAKTKHPLRNKMNENLFASFITPIILGLPLATLTVMFPSLLFPTSNHLVNNHLISLQQWILQLVSKQIIGIHNAKGQIWTLILMSLILFIGSTNLLGLLPHSFTPTTQLSINLGMAIPLWAGAVVTGFHNKTKAHFLPQGTPTPLIPILDLQLDGEESWALMNWCFWTVVLEKTLESPLGCKEIQPVHPKGDQSWVFIGRTDVEAETLVLWPPDVKSWLIWKDPDAGEDWGQEKKGTTEDEMVGWHHWLDGHGFGWTLGVGDGQGGLASCSPWGCKESDTTQRLNWTEREKVEKVNLCDVNDCSIAKRYCKYQSDIRNRQFTQK